MLRNIIGAFGLASRCIAMVSLLMLVGGCDRSPQRDGSVAGPIALITVINTESSTMRDTLAAQMLGVRKAFPELYRAIVLRDAMYGVQRICDSTCHWVPVEPIPDIHCEDPLRERISKCGRAGQEGFGDCVQAELDKGLCGSFS